MRPKILVANWKMNVAEPRPAEKLLSSLPTVTKNEGATRVIICPPFVWLQHLAAKAAAKGFELGGQNCAADEEGPHTGEISARMLAAVGCTWVILGHCERRRGQNEDDKLLAMKLKLAAAAGLRVILCVGEEEGERAEPKLEAQLAFLARSVRPAAVAYEPVWAIGSGKTPTPSQIAAAHGAVRHFLGEKETPILYGGSVDDGNIAQLAAVKECGGFLVGGASVSAKKFGKMIAVLGKIG